MFICLRKSAKTNKHNVKCREFISYHTRKIRTVHNVIWSRCPKTTFVGKRKLHGAVASAVAAFNEGAVHTSQVLKKRAIEPHEILNINNEQQDAPTVVKSRKSSTLVAKRRRTEKWVADRQRRHQAGAVEGASYVPGGF